MPKGGVDDGADGVGEAAVLDEMDDGFNTDGDAPKGSKKKKKSKKSKKSVDMASQTQKKPSRLATLFKTRVMLREKEGVDYAEEARTTLRELIIYIFFLVLTCLMSFGMITSTHFYYTNAIDNLFGVGFGAKAITFSDISTAEDAWDWLEGPLVDGLFPTHYYNGEKLPISPGDVLEESKLLGTPRLRQLRVDNQSCADLIPDAFKDTIGECYAKYTLGDEDTAEMVPAVDGTRSVMNATAGAWTHQTEEETGSSWVIGKYASTKYSGGGFVQMLPRNHTTAAAVVGNLKELRWIDQGTRAVFVDFTTYNANVNLFCVGRYELEFPPTGGVIASQRLLTLKLIRYVTKYDTFLMVCEVIFCLFILFYTIEEIMELKVLGWSVFKHPWDLLDWVILIAAYIGIAFNVFRLFFMKEKLQEAIDNPDTFANFDRIAYWQWSYNTMAAVLVFVIWIKTFKYLSFNYTMTLLSRTLTACALDLLGYFVMFFIVFLAYAQFGYLVFGPTTFGFHTFQHSIYSLLRIILGDFDFYALVEANRVVGPIFFISYVCVVFFILINVFLAIINDSYVEEKTKLEHSEYESEMGRYIGGLWRGFKQSFKRKILRRKAKVDPNGEKMGGDGERGGENGESGDDFDGDPENGGISPTHGGSGGGPPVSPRGKGFAGVAGAAITMKAVNRFSKHSSSMRRMSMEIASAQQGMNSEMNARMVQMEERIGSIAAKVEALLVAMGNIEIAQVREIRRTSKLLNIDESGAVEVDA